MAKKEEYKEFDPTAKVKMIATKEAPHHDEGEEIEVHPNIAHAVYIKNGYAKFADSRDAEDFTNVNPNVEREAKGEKATTKKA